MGYILDRCCWGKGGRVHLVQVLTGHVLFRFCWEGKGRGGGVRGRGGSPGQGT